MSDSLGALCIVLHGHLPYVLHHGTHPHGESWLYEAAAETYLPLLDLIGEVALHKTRPALTVGLTPVLLEQLANERFRSGFVAYLNERAARARQDRQEFERRNDPTFAALASRWEQWYADRLADFERIGRGIPKQFADRCREGHIQILTSTATHAYTPLLLNDQTIRAQFACGTATTARRLGLTCRGMWLPECAYRPTWEHWVPSVLFDDARFRVGLEFFMAGAGIDHFFVDTHLVRDARPLEYRKAGEWRPADADDPIAHWEATDLAWGSPLQPVGVASQPEPPRCFALARHPKLSEQVWSGTIGYPAAGEYLEFHRKQGDRGLRYHRVTDRMLPLSDKRAYEPSHVEAKVYEHSQHFCAMVRELLAEFKRRTGRTGVCVAPFDAELFGHWWFEGPEFLRNVIYTLSRDGQVELLTAEQALDRDPPDKVARLPEGSWGEHGNHSVWINDRTRWMWEMEYRAENRLLQLVHNLPWQADGRVRGMLERAGRELLLLQASDWPFIVHSGAAADYAIQRFAGHCTRFDRMCNIAADYAGGREPGPIERVEVEEADLHDVIFPEISLGWWM
jgi:1,4-alpha-glucan branching enzyme